MVATATVNVNALERFGTKAPNKTNPLEAIRAANADFTLRKVPLATVLAAGDSIPGQHIIFRDDSNTAIGMVGENYEPISNREFFVPIAEQLIEHSGAQVDSFCTLEGGARAFMRLSWPEDRNLRIGGAKVGDIVGRRATLSTSHDSKWAGTLTLELLRLACSNGMTVPIGQFSHRMVHTVGGKQQLVNIVEIAPKIETYVRQFAAAAGIFADTPVEAGSKICLRLVKKIVDPAGRAKETKGGDDNAALARVNYIMELFGGKQPEADNKAVKNTAWGLFQAVTDFLNHGKRIRGEDEVAQRFKSLLPGGGAQREIVNAWGIMVNSLKLKSKIDTATEALLN